MPAKQLLEIARLKGRVRQGENVPLGNVAILYRDIGNHRRAFAWWRKAAAAGDGDASVDIGYCLQYGIGVRPSVRDARRAFETAMRADLITEHGQEEARYHLALLHLDTKGTAGAKDVAALLTTETTRRPPPSSPTLRPGLRELVAAGAACVGASRGRWRARSILGPAGVLVEAAQQRGCRQPRR